MNTSPLRRLAERAGIAFGYRDTWGNDHDVSDATLLGLLRAMKLPADSNDAIAASLARLDDMEHAARVPFETAASAWRPPALTGAGRRWGIAVQLYALRAPDTWGIGDFSALADLVHGAAALGACAIGINPLHALFPTRPEHASPYSPSSRRFINPLYLDVETIEDFATSEAAQAEVMGDAFQARLHTARDAPLVVYGAVAELKMHVLAMLYNEFRSLCLDVRNHPRGRAFRRFQSRHDSHLRHFATFHALAEFRPEMDWRDWPPAFAHPDAPAVTAFASEHAEAVEFHEYLQWQAALQLEQVNQAARDAGMSIGLYTDLAVGADPTGAESWDEQPFLASGATIGAPPDALNLLGQNWGLPPPDPFALARAGYASSAGLWQANMRDAGALRIDHILGLMRLYWIPAGASAADGAYVRYPWHDLRGVLAAQSRRNHCMVIGEDLGTVPEGLHEGMRETGILSYRVLVFEQHDSHFRAPHEYPAEALVTAGTHDLPSLPMWWSGEDIELRDQLGLWPDAATREVEREHRSRARSALADALRNEGLHSGEVPHEAPVDAVHTFLARTPCKLLMVQPEDVLGLHVQINVPGTTVQYPNWRQRLPCSVEELLAHPRMQRIAAMLKDEGRSDR